ncbi:sulfite exporter TauE/SafE family protein [Parafrigoribacterium soli]|uniref:sulfite exporter TauE/SafE family protein n=1 Tax=Parafrigoribacterium soli TaxID=3144663 RepID=UPI0032EB19E8
MELVALVAVAGLLAGAVNTLAGGGTLLVYPALLACGLPPVSANITSLIGLTPGYIGGAFAYRKEILEERRRLPVLIIATVLGAAAGAIILLTTPSAVFQLVIPYLVLFSSLLLLAQPWLQRRLAPAATPDVGRATSPLPAGGVFLGSVYGSYFSAGVGVLLLAFLGATIRENFQRINGLKNVLSLVIILTGVAVYAFSSQVNWWWVLVLLPSSAVGGVVGGWLARRLNADILRYIVCALGLALAVALFVIG